MNVIMKCSAVCSDAGAAFGFTVRHGHCIVHRESGLLPCVASVEAAKQESVRRAVGWLLAQPATAAHVSIRCDSEVPAPDSLAAELIRFGGAVAVESVCPERVSEAAALSRRTALAAIRSHGLAAQAVCATASARAATAPAAAGLRAPVFPLGRTLHPRRGAGADAEADAIIICDGGYKPHPYGIATYACLAWTGVRLAYQESGVVCWGRAARNYVAELAAAVAALRWLASSPLAGGARVQLRSDNQWVVDTLTGRCRRRPLPGTVMLLRTADRLMARLERCGCEVAVWKVPRKSVAQADALCRKAYRERLDRVGVGNARQSLKAFLRPASTEWQSRV